MQDKLYAVWYRHAQDLPWYMDDGGMTAERAGFRLSLLRAQVYPIRDWHETEIKVFDDGVDPNKLEVKRDA